MRLKDVEQAAILSAVKSLDKNARCICLVRVLMTAKRGWISIYSSYRELLRVVEALSESVSSDCLKPIWTLRFSYLLGSLPIFCLSSLAGSSNKIPLASPVCENYTIRLPVEF